MRRRGRARGDPSIAARGGADAGQNREVGRGDVAGDRRAEPAEGDLDGADVAGAVAADRDVHSRPFVDGSAGARARDRGARARGRPP